MSDNFAGADALASVQEFSAPAKINRFLHVTRRRADGYHQIQTQFQFLDFADSLRFEITKAPHLRRIDQHDFALPDEDLIIRAAKLLQSHCPAGDVRGVEITVQKQIPPGSGLGGGSSNAATTLLALNHLWQLGLSRARLLELALQLGADVPVFVFGRAAFAGGIGEALRACEPPERWLCVCLPPVHVLTERVFENLCIPRRHGDSPAPNWKSGEEPTDNDLEATTASLYPAVATALEHLRQHAHGDARMSGSGAAVFSEFDTREQAQHALEQLPARYGGFITQSRNRHPLVDF